jgi:hypothetical protein
MADPSNSTGPSVHTVRRAWTTASGTLPSQRSAAGANNGCRQRISSVRARRLLGRRQVLSMRPQASQ